VRCVDLKTALGKQRKDGKSAPLQPLTTMQRTHIRRLVEKHGDDIEVRSIILLILSFLLCVMILFLSSNIYSFEQGMYRDRKLNSMQHSVATLRKLCTRYQIYKDKNPILVSWWWWWSLYPLFNFVINLQQHYNGYEVSINQNSVFFLFRSIFMRWRGHMQTYKPYLMLKSFQFFHKEIVTLCARKHTHRGKQIKIKIIFTILLSKSRISLKKPQIKLYHIPVKLRHW